eukprot:762048-Hanusia_phi.AAC.2
MEVNSLPLSTSSTIERGPSLDLLGSLASKSAIRTGGTTSYLVTHHASSSRVSAFHVAIAAVVQKYFTREKRNGDGLRHRRSVIAEAIHNAHVVCSTTVLVGRAGGADRLGAMTRARADASDGSCERRHSGACRPQRLTGSPWGPHTSPPDPPCKTRRRMSRLGQDSPRLLDT